MPARPIFHEPPSFSRCTTRACRVGGLLEGRTGRADLDSGSVGRGQLGLAAGEFVRVLAKQADGAGRLVRAALQPDPKPVTGHHRHRRIVGGKDRLQAEAQHLAEE